MKLPRILELRQAVLLAIAAIVVAVALQLFAPLAIGILAFVAFVAACYAAILKWAPEFVKDA